MFAVFDNVYGVRPDGTPFIRILSSELGVGPFTLCRRCAAEWGPLFITYAKDQSLLDDVCDYCQNTQTAPCEEAVCRTSFNQTYGGFSHDNYRNLNAILQG